MNRRETIDGVTTYIDMTWRQVRDYRDMELSKSDWRAVKDRTLPNAWKLYRQFLRDLPQSYETANEACDAWVEYEKPSGWM